MLVTLAGKTLAGIARGLRKKFQPYASSVSIAIKRKRVVLSVRSSVIITLV